MQSIDPAAGTTEVPVDTDIIVTLAQKTDIAVRLWGDGGLSDGDWVTLSTTDNEVYTYHPTQLPNPGQRYTINVDLDTQNPAETWFVTANASEEDPTASTQTDSEPSDTGTTDTATTTQTDTGITEDPLFEHILGQIYVMDAYDQPESSWNVPPFGVPRIDDVVGFLLMPTSVEDDELVLQLTYAVSDGKGGYFCLPGLEPYRLWEGDFLSSPAFAFEETTLESIKAGKLFKTFLLSLEGRFSEDGDFIHNAHIISYLDTRQLSEGPEEMCRIREGHVEADCIPCPDETKPSASCVLRDWEDTIARRIGESDPKSWVKTCRR